MIGVKRRGAEIAALRQGIEHEVDLGLARRIHEPRFRLGEDAIQGLEARVRGLHAAPHMLDRQEPPAHLDVCLAEPGRSRSPDVVIAILPRADDGRTADAAGNLPRQAARRGDGRKVALRRHGIAIDRSGLGDDEVMPIGDIQVIVGRAEIGAPAEPRLARMLGQQVFFLEAERQGEPLGSLADQEDVRRVLEDQLRHFRGRLDILERADRTRALRRTVHARGFELYDTRRVRQAAITDGVIVGIELLDLHALDDRVERVGALHEQVEGFLHRPQPVGARDRDGLGGPARLGRQRPRRPHRVRDPQHGIRGNTTRGRPQELATRQGVGHARFYPLVLRLSTCYRSHPVELSLVVPAYNERDNLAPLLAEIATALTGRSYEVIVVDDGSTDGTFDALKALRRQYPQLHIIAFERNAGQTAAFAAGFRAAHAPIVVTLDADLQNDPADIPQLVDTLERTGATAVAGYRPPRRATAGERLQSRNAKGVPNRPNGEVLRDTGCSLKAFRTEAVRALPLFTGVHRVLP